MRIALLLIADLAVPGRACPRARRRQQANHSAYDGFITEALTAYDAGRWAEARSSFRPRTSSRRRRARFRTLGMCSFNLGDYVDALQNLESALTDTRKPVTSEQRGQTRA